MAETGAIQPTSSVGSRGAQNNISASEAMANRGLSSAREDATSALEKKGVTADKAEGGGLKDAQGNGYTFNEARDKVAGLMQERDNAGTASEKRAIGQEIDKFIGELAASLKPGGAGQGDAAKQGGGAEAPKGKGEAQKGQGEAPKGQGEAQKGGGASQGAGGSPQSASGMPQAAQQALDGVSGEDLMSMLDDEDGSELQSLIDKLKQAGASPEQIKAALKAKAAEAIKAQGGSAADVEAAGKKIDAAVDKSFEKSASSDAPTSRASTDMVKTYG